MPLLLLQCRHGRAEAGHQDRIMGVLLAPSVTPVHRIFLSYCSWLDPCWGSVKIFLIVVGLHSHIERDFPQSAPPSWVVVVGVCASSNVCVMTASESAVPAGSPGSPPHCKRFLLHQTGHPHPYACRSWRWGQGCPSYFHEPVAPSGHMPLSVSIEYARYWLES